MASMAHLCLFFTIMVFLLVTQPTGIQGVGVNYGLLGDNLPTPDKVIALLQSRSIQNVRIFDPNADVLKALQGSSLQVIVGVRNQDLQQLSTDASVATNWVRTNVIPYASTVSFKYISAGNEVIPGPLAAYVLSAMKNLDGALKAAGLSIPVTTCVSMQVLASSYPPSQGVFSESASPMGPITVFLEANQSPLLVNVYPYFAYNGDSKNIQLGYALLTSTNVVTVDGSLRYDNIFYAMVDAVYAALEKAGGPNVEVVVSETGWPSAGNGNIATTANARSYINNLIGHVSAGSGTPRRPGKALETYLFAIFNENLKPAGEEQNFGIYYPNMTEVYHVNFS
ncbi:PREDICTED: putative glucan endo-1,3-beta-glucosidase GVI [Nelumbo nucifera]|uniref:Glucan endo-1,3-beta-glucosidase GVI n=2 Tax=Nelumbo nucifera TaxID=4432 RepID=A0A1U8B812_NELNU|nr:PREDICTED: putative glucan endo-1,3-beta-glucosidase GVI [Nelumbo nucifera]DAD46026.1 TPA_asm: hypothetical protein HUJ06_004256 [Nelumbo nucifera]